MFYFMLSKISGTLYSVLRVTNDGNFNFLSICLPYSFSHFLYQYKSKHDPCFLMPNPSLPIILFYFQLYHFAIFILETKLFIPFPISYVCFVCLSRGGVNHTAFAHFHSNVTSFLYFFKIYLPMF